MVICQFDGGGDLPDVVGDCPGQVCSGYPASRVGRQRSHHYCISRNRKLNDTIMFCSAFAAGSIFGRLSYFTKDTIVIWEPIRIRATFLSIRNLENTCRSGKAPPTILHRMCWSHIVEFGKLLHILLAVNRVVGHPALVGDVAIWVCRAPLVAGRICHHHSNDLGR